MNNFYYYFFYSIAIFARRVNKRDRDFTFSSLIFVSLCIGLNFLGIIFIIDGFTSVSLNIKVSIIIMAAIVFGVNYLLLMKNGKDTKIIQFYDSKYENRKHNFWNVFFVIAYIIFSYGICIYAAYLTKVTS